MTIPVSPAEVPYLTTSQMVEVDRAMIEDYRIELTMMMESAGRNLAHLARVRFLGGDARGGTAVVLAGTGGNGGGALVCARRLSNWGARVRVLVTKPEDQFTPVAGRQLDILARMGVHAHAATELEAVEVTGAADLIVDGLIGYGLSGPPRGAAAELIGWANERGSPILALDAPSGLDLGGGLVHEPAIRATATMTLALPKEGLRPPGVAPYVGELYLADIGVPPDLYARPPLELEVGHIFSRNDIVRLR